LPNYRCYFNRKAEAPQVFSVDEGDQSTETNVLGWVTHSCDGKTEYFPGVKVNPDTPTVVFHVEDAVMRLEHGWAHFYRDPDAYLAKVTEATNKRLGEMEVY
jgi:hypothetical protein